MNLKPRPGDFILVGLLLSVILLLPVFLTGSGTGTATAVVTQEGRELSRIRLTGLEKTIRVEYGGGHSGTILAENGRIRFEESDCPDQVCVDTGWLSKPGQTAACLPARVLIRIEGTVTGDVDVKLR